LSKDPNRDRSKTQLLRARQAEEGRKAMAEYQANAAAVRLRTERLRALRLEREAAEQAATPTPATKKERRSKPGVRRPGRPQASSSQVTTGKVSDWLQDQRDSGHNI